MTVVPFPNSVCSSTVPPRLSTLALTTSIPTPRPEMLVTCSAVVTPLRNTKLAICFGLMRSVRLEGNNPFDAAARLTRSTSIPAPSSETSMRTSSQSRYARTMRQPSGDFPASTLRDGISTPWSMELRTKCISGALISSRISLSSSKSWPSRCRQTRLPPARARSLARRGKRAQSTPIGCVRACLDSC